MGAAEPRGPREDKAALQFEGGPNLHLRASVQRAGAFFALGLIMFALGARDRAAVVGPFFFALLLSIPCGLIALLGAYVRRGFAKSLDAEGVRGTMGQRFAWEKLYYVDHVSQRFRGGG